MIIYASNKSTLLDITVDDNSYRNRAIMGDDNITLYYSLAEHVELAVGCYCVFQGETYTLERPENFKMKHSRHFEYTVVFEASQAKAKKWKFRNPVDGRLKFPLTAKPKEHLQMFVDNMNRRDNGWTIGECISGTEKLISYNHNYCLEALQQIAKEYETEYEIVGKRVSLRKIEYNRDNPLALSYGRGNGFKSGVGRSNQGDKPPVEILYVQGGAQNIDRSKYGSSELLLPKNQTIVYDGKHFDNEDGFNAAISRHYVVDDLGLSIRRADKEPSSLAEDSLDAVEIYPKRVGKVTKVVAIDAEKGIYDIIDNTIPDALDYGEYQIEGETITIIFQTGMLAGREFEVTYYHDPVKQKLGRRFEIVPTELDGMTMPKGAFVPVVGDEYAVFHCALPEAYVRHDATRTGASWDMFRHAVKYMYEHEEHSFTFTGELDGIWAKKDWENIGGRIKLGGYVLFSDKQFQKDGALVRITGVKEYINNPHSPEIELSNTTVSGGFSSTLGKLENEEVVNEKNYRDALQFTKRRFRDARETISMLEDAFFNNFTQSISPLSVSAMSMLVGDESLQFRFVSHYSSSAEAVPCPVVWNNETKQITSPNCNIQHLTLGIDSISPSHDAKEYMMWSVASYASSYLENGSTKYYLYIKASKTTRYASFVLSETAIKMNMVNGYYHFLVGILNSEFDGERSFVTLYGFTEILPGRVTTDRIVSSEGTSYFDMLNNAMKLGDVFDFNSQGDGKLRLQGTLVQSQSGQESYLGCYRGVYNNGYVYYNGDEVIYTVNNNTSTYRFISDTPAQGIAPTNTVYWQVVAAGTKGQDGADGADGTSVTIKGQFGQLFNNMSDFVPPQTGERFHLINFNDTGDETYHWYKEYGRPFAGAAIGWMTRQAAVGDAFIQTGTGNLYVAVENGWDNVGQIKGDKGDQGEKGETGDNGTDGKFTELRYAKNGSTTVAPKIDKTTLSPVGWSTIMPTVSSVEYLWLSVAVKSGDGKTLLQQWSTPCRITPYNGKDGSNGKSPAMVFRGVYDSTKTYYGNEYRLDCVKNGSEYFIARIDAGTFSNIAPPSTNKWNSFGASFDSVATNLLLAENANIAGWIFRNGRLESQNGAAYLNGVTGEVKFANGNFTVDNKGNVTVNGNFVGKISTQIDGNRIIIDASTNSIVMYNHIQGNSINGIDVEVLKIEGEDVGFGLIRPRIVMREYANDGSVMGTIKLSSMLLGMYRYDRDDIPFFEISGGWSSKRIKIGDLALPTTKPTTAGTLWKSGDTIKIS